MLDSCLLRPWVWSVRISVRVLVCALSANLITYIRLLHPKAVICRKKLCLASAKIRLSSLDFTHVRRWHGVAKTEHSVAGGLQKTTGGGEANSTKRNIGRAQFSLVCGTYNQAPTKYDASA